MLHAVADELRSCASSLWCLFKQCAVHIQTLSDQERHVCRDDVGHRPRRPEACSRKSFMPRATTTSASKLRLYSATIVRLDPGTAWHQLERYLCWRRVIIVIISDTFISRALFRDPGVLPPLNDNAAAPILGVAAPAAFQSIVHTDPASRLTSAAARCDCNERMWTPGSWRLPVHDYTVWSSNHT